MNPANIAALALPTLIAWSLADDYQKARIKRGLATPKHDPAPPQAMPLERLYTQPTAHPIPTPQPTPIAPLNARLEKLKAVFGDAGLLPYFHLSRYPGCIRATGYQRSGKSTRIQVLALLRQVQDPQHRVMVATPHKPTKGDSEWPSSFSVHGEGNQWGEVRAVCDAVMDSLAKGDCTPRTYILDEFSGYLGHGGMDNGYLQEFMLSMVRETAKHHCQVILIQHGDTAAMSGGIKGLSSAVWGNLPTLQCHRVLSEGIPTPSPQAEIVGGGFPDTALQFPQWINPQWLLKNFPELASIAPATVPPQHQGAAQQPPDFTIDLTGLMAKDQTATTLEPNPGLPEHLAAVLDYVRRKGTATPRQIQQAKLSVLADSNNNTSGNIQLILDSLLLAGLVQLSTDGSYAPLGVGQQPQ